MIGVGSSLLKTYHRVHCQKVTEEHQHEVLKAIEWFVSQEKRMPSAASLETQGHENLGQWFGVVPYRTLGLSQHTAKDGFGHWMHFVVDHSLTNIEFRKHRPLTLCKFFLDPSSNVTLREKGESIIPSRNHNGIACIVISHGPKGIGAPGRPSLPSGQAGLSQGKLMNMQEGFEYCYSPALDDTGVWDDYVSFRTKQQILEQREGRKRSTQRKPPLT